MSRRFAPSLLFVACLGPAASGRARADEPAVTVRAERPAADGQASTRLDLAARRTESLHLGNLVGGVPGALALDFGGILATTTVSLRGGTADQAVVLLDGVPLGSPAGGGLDLALVPAALLEGVVIERGSDARLGAGAMGGAIQLSPAKGTRLLLTGGSQQTLGLSGSLSREVAGPDAVWTLCAAADARRSAGDFTFHRDPTPEIAGNDAPRTLSRANNDATLRSLLLRAERRSDAGTLGALAFGTWSERGLPGPMYSLTPLARQDEKSVAAQLSWKSGRLELPLFARLGALGIANGDAVTLSGRQHFSDVGLRPSWREPLGTWILGASGLVAREDFEGTQHGIHARARAGLGLELSRDRGTVTGSVALRAEAWGPAIGLLPRAGGSVHLAKGLVAYANAGGGFRPPSFGELFYAAGPVLPNPDLRPERSWSGDLGLRLDRPGERSTLTGAVTGYAGLYDDVIVYELFSGSRAKPFNLGRARTAGVEAEARLKLDGGALQGLGGGVSATYLRTTNLVPGPNTFGRDLPYRPRTRASFHLDFERDRVRASTGLDWTGEAFANRADTRSVASFADVRGSLSVRLGGDVWLSAEVRNALDVVDRACLEGYPLPGRVFLAHLAWLPDTTPTERP